MNEPINMIFLYWWDNKKDIFYVGEKSEIVLHPFYRSQNANVRGANGYQISAEEGKVYQNKLWLRERDDKKAKELFLEHYKKKKMYLENQITKLWRKINCIDSLPVDEAW